VGDLRKEIANGFRQQHSKRRNELMTESKLMANGKGFLKRVVLMNGWTAEQKM
jgi:hypothetical protein